jgi:SAM-dependent methyltransferase
MRPSDLPRFFKAAASNLLAGVSPPLYVRLTRQTGRGRDDIEPGDVARYFITCVDDYAAQLKLDASGFDAFLLGRNVLEYGPGDVLGVALVLYARGAAKVTCVDRFPLERISATNAEVYRKLIESLQGPARERARRAFCEPGQPESGFAANTVCYSVTQDGLAAQPCTFDLVLSRAVLEHVNRLESTIDDIAAALRPGGISIHCVDLRSHGLDRRQVLDFLTWSDWAYALMYSNKGFPNRWRVDKYRDCLRRSGLRLLSLTPTDLVSHEDARRIVDRLPRALRGASTEDLRWLGFWFVAEPSAAGALAAKR